MRLCYKSYSFKMTLGAMKQFKQATGKDLWCTLLKFLEEFTNTSNLPPLSRMQSLYSVVDFETASHAFHSLIRAEDKNIPIEEIEDAMFRVGWMPSDRDGDMSEPWPLVLVQVALDINEQFKTDTADAKK